MFVVMSLQIECPVSVKDCRPPLVESLKMSFADGMVGVLPVFETYAEAEKFADGSEIIEITRMKNERR